ncbi:terminase family protein [Enterobacteriaceae bacterium G50]|nr:terminase family protein [Enterobacteriaceae bacterium G50]
MEVLEALEAVTQNPDLLMQMEFNERQEFIKNAFDYLNYKKYNRIEFFKPYPYQQRFMNAGSSYEVRYMRAGNRVGKTYGGAAEFAYHLTGEYPEDWKGFVVPDGGHTYWVVGITLESVAKVIQKELIGTPDCRVKEMIGTGTIPRKNIVTDQGWTPDGAKLKSCLVRHKDGSLNTLMFYGCENVAVMMGQEVIGCWLDEESLNSEEVYAQCVARVTNAGGPGNNGFIMITATPERGMTNLNKKFDNDDSGLLYLQSVSWDDCPRFNPETIEKELKKYPEWQHEMRRRGLPVLGQGAVFPFDDSALRVQELNILPHWNIVIAVDWGKTIDPSVVMVAAHDPDSDTYYLVDCYYLNEDEQARSPQNVARVILESPYRCAPVVVPHDSGAKATQLKALGVNVHGQTFRNPPVSFLKVQNIKTDNQSVRDIETGLTEMRYMMQEGRLKILPKCEKWFDEKRAYFYKKSKISDKVEPSGEDHAIDASRYALLSLMGGIGCYYSDVMNDATASLQSFSTIQY